MVKYYDNLTLKRESITDENQPLKDYITSVGAITTLPKYFYNADKRLENVTYAIWGTFEDKSFL